MAKKKKKSNKKSQSSASAVPKPIKSKMTKKQLVTYIASVVDGTNEPSKETRRIVNGTIDTLANVIMRSIQPGGVGTFMLPRLFKVFLKERKAIKPGTMVRSPATGGMVPSKGRPASKMVKIRSLAALKKAAAGYK